ncbi:MAG: bifunctional glutamate N-acetyltransferase/amino-acid acetyltransferase ArgJ [Candidatus Marinimicrobia bacterium]|nr:bifunctional glutamate N-acetyltransferase/amino-acid acetyltransferase ArgJ [Candidatus Neomarinimicrobiota bacterium]MCK9560279.1 bifunctional glutamate N-acetyltransferase/amino-acid acetyltransferase ArgJ [Candidatus Neomarinimicrobiota bacterium]
MNFYDNPKITDPKGFTGAAMHAGFKRKRKDLCIIKSAVPAKCSAKFTTNAVKAAPLIVAMENLRKTGNRLQTLIINSGNANAGTGQQGLNDVNETLRLLATQINIPPELILASSTGVIGHRLDMDKMRYGIEHLARHLSVEGGAACAEAILTTDTVTKSFGLKFTANGKKITLCGITKGSGMIQPNMATTLAFVTTDADIDHDFLEKSFSAAVEHSYNMITVDGHTSTNDTALIMANGLAGNPTITAGSPSGAIFEKALFMLMTEMAKSIVRDGEGATKFVTISIDGADDFADARKMAFGIANSMLVKAALFGCDPNWGRILSAAGMVFAHFDPAVADLRINGIYLYRHGEPLSLNNNEIEAMMAPVELNIVLDCNLGEASAVVYTTDLSYDYVKINAQYHT